jgi:hypothetical protein
MNLGLGLSLSSARAVSAPAVAPVLASSLDFGRLTRTGAGGTPIATSASAITSASINSGTNSNHWQITSAGIITPSATGVAAGLSASYTLNVTATNATGPTTGSVTINTEANAYDITGADITTGNAELTAVTTHLGTGVAVATNIYMRAGTQLSFTTTTEASWFKNKAHTAEITFQGRTTIDNNPPVLDCAADVFGSAWNNFRFKNMKWNLRFLRETMGDTTYAVRLSGTIGKIVWEDCDIAGDCLTLEPGQHYKGFFGISNSGTTNVAAADIQILGGRIHGLWRSVNAARFTSPVGGPCLRFKMNDVDVYDMGLDGLYIANEWTNIEVTNNYFHSPYINKKRLFLSDSQDDVYVRNTAWTGAADGKKLFMVWAGQFRSVAGSVDCLYMQGATGSPRVKLVRDAAGNIVFTAADSGGSTIVTMTSASTYSGGSFKMVVAVSVDTDGTSRMYIWKEQNGGGGAWSSAASAASSGSTMNLNSSPVSLAGTPTKTEKFHGYYTRTFVWYGIAPDLTSTTVQNYIIDSTNGRDTDVATLIGAYGTPILQQEGDTAYWVSLSSALGTGGNWDDVGQPEIDHGDLIQTAANATVNGWTFTDNVLSSGFDVSPQYARATDPGGLYEQYYEMQGMFMEDINTDNYMTGAVIDRNIIMCASGWAIAPYNGKDCFIRDNVVFVPDEWGYDVSNYPTVRILEHGSAPNTGGNTVTNNWAYSYTLTVGSTGTANTTTPANNGDGVTPANYSSYMVAGAAPTTKAEILAFVAGAI